MKMVNRKSRIIVFALIALCFCSRAFAAPSSSDLIVDTKFVMDKTGKPGWVFIDMRFADDFSQGHIPGAVALPAWVSKAYADDTKRQAKVIPRMVQSFGEMGVSNDSHVIVYGDPANTHWNTVLFWVLEQFGCNSTLLKCTVHYYDGGVERWKADGGTLDQTETQMKPATFKAVEGTRRSAKTDEILKIIEGKQKSVILDVRTPGEYGGTDVRALRGGHIPRAVNVDYANNFDAGTFRMLPLDQLQSLYKDIPKDMRVITHCQTGQRAAYSYLVLRALGYRDVAIYHDGWRVYGSDLKLPVEDETWYDFNKINTTIKAVNKLQEKM
jgi:thiosulfate/3-mercaptopyruvate sulfurtransferase